MVAVGEVVELFSTRSVDDAWGSYTEYARELAANPDLLTDRAFHEEFQRRYMRWARLFRAAEERR